MADLNVTLATVHSIGTTVSTILTSVKILVGGVFGLYLIILLVRWHEYSLTKSMLREIDDRLITIEKKLSIPLKQKRTVTQEFKSFAKHLGRENVAVKKALLKK